MGRVRRARVPAGAPPQGRAAPAVAASDRGAAPRVHTPYPLAAARPCIYDRELVLEVHERDGLLTPSEIVIRPGQEMLLGDGAKQRFEKVEFANRKSKARSAGYVPRTWRHRVIDPLVRFGRPSVSGMSTERPWELADAGEAIDEIAKGLKIPKVTPCSRMTAPSKVMPSLAWALAATGPTLRRSWTSRSSVHPA
jgi:hypothetical protein